MVSKFKRFVHQGGKFGKNLIQNNCFFISFPVKSAVLTSQTFFVWSFIKYNSYFLTVQDKKKYTIIIIFINHYEETVLF